MLLIIFGILDFGRAIYALNTLSNSARTGARVAIIDQSVSTDCTLSTLPARCAAAKQAVALGIPASAVQVSFSKADATGTCSPQKIGCTVTVKVTYSFNAVTPIIGSIVGTLNLSQSSVLPIERAFASS
jgi:Flp pilus assembly protein TadG